MRGRLQSRNGALDSAHGPLIQACGGAARWSTRQKRAPAGLTRKKTSGLAACTVPGWRQNWPSRGDYDADPRGHAYISANTGPSAHLWRRDVPPQGHILGQPNSGDLRIDPDSRSRHDEQHRVIVNMRDGFRPGQIRCPIFIGSGVPCPSGVTPNRHEQFRDDYAGGDVDPAGTRHGSYWLDRITTQAYEPVTAATAIGVLSAWAHQFGNIPQLLEDTLEREIYLPVREATSLYRLKELGRAAFHDWGGVHIDFHELVIIDRVAGSLALMVAADD
jgi:hypothetical protein